MNKHLLPIAVLFIVAVPLFLVTASVTWAVNDLRLYQHGFDKFDIAEASGISDDGLMQASRGIRGYFNSRQEPLQVRAVVFGREMEIFSPKEVAHMRDVKKLIWGVYVVGAVALVSIGSAFALGYWRQGRAFTPTLARWAFWAGGLTVGLIAAIGLTALVAFDQLFLAFHQLSFANDFWQLDPCCDYLIIMFPNGFWYDATLFVGLVSILGGLLIAAAGAAYLLKTKRLALPWSKAHEKTIEEAKA
ncbi:MAG: TIGR01906 family membrane protein [SAR202 cluster bacterium]|nr:TIGR01906 family membrane protein [SAR202 cluster bacterium]